MQFSILPDSNDRSFVKTQTVDNFSDFCVEFLAQVKTQPPEREKRRLVGFSPIIFDRSHRKASNFVSAEFLAVDLDEGNTRIEIMNVLKNSRYSYLFIESPSSTEDVCKARIIFPIENPVMDAKKYKKSYLHNVRKVLPGLKIDEQCRDAARFFYIPNSSKKETLVFQYTGDPVLWEEDPHLLRKREPDFSEPPTNTTSDFFNNKERLKKQLCERLLWLQENKKSITASYSQWVDIGFGLISLKEKNFTKDQIFWLFNEFSKLDEKKYDNDDVCAKFEQLWNDYEPGIIGFEKVFSECKCQGYKTKTFYNSAFIIESAEITGRYHLALPNDEVVRYVELDRTPNEFNVLPEIVKRTDQFQLQRTHVMYQDNEGSLKDHALKYLKSLYRAVPEKSLFMLGADNRGRYYDKQENSMMISNHRRMMADPIKHPEVEEFFSHYNTPFEWLQKYFALLPKVDEVALPWIHLFGESRTGKSMFARVMASVWSSKPDAAFFKQDGFQDTAGNSPVIWMDEKLPTGQLNTIKEMITSKENYINRKYARATAMVGFPRMISSVNNSKLTLPHNDVTDWGAIKRRMHAVYQPQEETKYFDRVETFRLLDRFIDDGMFREYVAWCEENIEVPHSGDIIILKPIVHDDLKKGVFAISPSHGAILECFITLLSQKVSNPVFVKTEGADVYFKVGSQFSEYLIEKKYTKNIWNARKIIDVLERTFGELSRKRLSDKSNTRIRAFCVSKEKIIKVANDMEIDFE